MTKLFASHLAQKASPTSVTGRYDPEQELWVTDNQLLGVLPLATQTHKATSQRTVTYVNTWEVTGVELEGDIVKEPDTDPDTNNDSDNP
jgi:hypothetical protein